MWACWCSILCIFNISALVQSMFTVFCYSRNLVALAYAACVLCAFIRQSVRFCLFFLKIVTSFLSDLLFCIYGLLLISDISYISSVDFLPRDQRPSVPEDPELVNYQPQHSDEIRTPVLPPPVQRYSSSCSSFFCCRVWNSSTPDKICSVCKKPISKYTSC